MNRNISHQITPLSDEDCFAVFDRKKSKFDFPIHFHPEYELNYIYNAVGAKRIVGDHIGEVREYELVLVGPNLIHCWEQGFCNNESMHEITILFHSGLFHNSLLNRQAMHRFKAMLQLSQRGIAFSADTILKVKQKLETLSTRKGHYAFLEFLGILFELSTDERYTILSGIHHESEKVESNDKIKIVQQHIIKYFHEKIKLQTVARLVNTTPVSFSRMIKKKTGRTFIDILNEYRVGYASRMLIETEKSIAEIFNESGFNNQAHFNRIFKRKKGCSPSSFRNNFAGVKQVW
jgi:AraC-like DNA-binding protein